MTFSWTPDAMQLVSKADRSIQMDFHKIKPLQI